MLGWRVLNSVRNGSGLDGKDKDGPGSSRAGLAGSASLGNGSAVPIYRLDIPMLSEAEEQLVCLAEERFREATRTLHHTNDREGNQQIIKSILVQAAEQQGSYLDRDQVAYLSKIATMHIYGFAFIDALLRDSEIEEISIIGPRKPAYVYIRNKGWLQTNAMFDNERAITDVINKMANNLGRHITMQHPRLDAMLPDGSRFHASLSPISQGEITIRRFRDRPFSPKELIGNGTMDAGVVAFLSILMQGDNSLVIAGNTASGKTTTMNALFSFVPANERIIITEETPEINIPHEHQLRLVANKEMGITLKDLVYDSLRMRPDRMIVGEVRNKEEAEALFDVLLAGQARGSYATMHAQSVDEAITRLGTFGIGKLDIASVDCIVVQRRMLLYDPKKRSSIEKRIVTEVAEMTGDGTKTIYRAGDGSSGNMGRIESSDIIGRMAESFGLDRKGMLAELRYRAKAMMSADSEYTGFFTAMQNVLFSIRNSR